MNILGIIPARYASTRFPGKPLAMLAGRPLIQHVYERASQALDSVVVATDDQRIADAVTAFGGSVVLTSPDHPSGTDRCREAAKLAGGADAIINIQGDEPFVSPTQISDLAALLERPGIDIATLARPFDASRGFEALADPNLVKVVLGIGHDHILRALYFSRSVIPYVRGTATDHWPDHTQYFTHVGLYGYRTDVLDTITAMERSPLECAESLEQLRWLQAGYSIAVALTTEANIGIDTPADLEAARLIIEKGGMQ